MTTDEANRWLKQAEDDLAYGRLGLDDYLRAATWQFQQAAEKSLKGLLIRRGVEFPRTHDTARLLTLVKESGLEVDAVREASLRLANLLPAIRYPADFTPITREEAKEAEADATQVFNWV